MGEGGSQREGAGTVPLERKPSSVANTWVLELDSRGLECSFCFSLASKLWLSYLTP